MANQGEKIKLSKPKINHFSLVRYFNTANICSRAEARVFLAGIGQRLVPAANIRIDFQQARLSGCGFP